VKGWDSEGEFGFSSQYFQTSTKLSARQYQNLPSIAARFMCQCIPVAVK